VLHVEDDLTGNGNKQITWSESRPASRAVQLNLFSKHNERRGYRRKSTYISSAFLKVDNYKTNLMNYEKRGRKERPDKIDTNTNQE
jgi:hypothetical protein